MVSFWKDLGDCSRVSVGSVCVPLNEPEWCWALFDGWLVGFMRAYFCGFCFLLSGWGVLLNGEWHE